MSCVGNLNRNNMKTDSPQKASGMNLRSIFRCMMEEGYYPVFEHTHIQFGLEDNIGIAEYEEGILSVRLFFSIDEDAYDLFLEASNMTMLETFCVKPAVLDDMKNIMFGCEIFCDNIRDFKRFFPRACSRLKEALMTHKSEMKKLILASEVANATIPAKEDSMTGIVHKIFS